MKSFSKHFQLQVLKLVYATKNELKTAYQYTYLAGNHNNSIPGEVFVGVLITGVINQREGWIDSAANHSEGKSLLFSEDENLTYTWWGSRTVCEETEVGGFRQCSPSHCAC